MTLTTPLVAVAPARVFAPERGDDVDEAGWAETPTRAIVDEATIAPSFGSMAGVTDEDLDSTPVPTGCPRCWEGPGATKSRCTNCPARRAVR